MTTTKATAESYAALKYCKDVRKDAHLAEIIEGTMNFHVRRREKEKANEQMLKKAKLERKINDAKALFDAVGGVGAEVLKYLYIDGRGIYETSDLVGYSQSYTMELARQAREALYPMLPEVYKKSAKR